MTTFPNLCQFFHCFCILIFGFPFEEKKILHLFHIRHLLLLQKINIWEHIPNLVLMQQKELMIFCNKYMLHHNTYITIIITRPRPAQWAGSWGHDTGQAVTFCDVLRASLRASGAQLRLKPMKNQPGIMKNQTGTMKNHNNQPGIIKN